MFPLVFNPSYMLGGPQFGVPVTKSRVIGGTALALPGVILTYLVFTVPTDNYLWTCSAGILGGPILALSGLFLFTDKSSTIEATPQYITTSNKALQNAYSLLAIVGFIFWYSLVYIGYQVYGYSLNSLWRNIWTEAGPSVAFMTIDTGVLYLGILIFLAFQSEKKALKAAVLTPFVGPATAVCLALKDLEQEAATALLSADKQKVL